MADRISDNDLHELLRAVDDDNLDAAIRERVKRLCEHNTDAQQTLDEFVSSREVLDLAEAHMLRAPVAETLVRRINDWQPPKGQSNWHSPLRAVAGVTFIALLSATLGWQIAQHRAADGAMQGHSWVQAVLDYQILYTRATLEHVDVAPGDRERTAQRLSQALGAELKIPDLSQYGMHFKRGQVLAFGEDPVIQMAYLPGNGEPLAYCVSLQSGPNLAPKHGRDRGLNYVTWRQDGVARVLVAAASATQLQAISDSLTASMAGG